MNMKNYKMTQAEIHWWNALHVKKSALEGEFRSFWTDVSERIGLPEVPPGMQISLVDGVSVVAVPTADQAEKPRVESNNGDS